MPPDAGPSLTVASRSRAADILEAVAPLSDTIGTLHGTNGQYRP
jgi:hypothetical protein